MNVPNLLTSSRILISPFLYYAGISQKRDLFVVLFLIGGLTDALDGFFARYLDMKSDWGTVFDTVADVLFYPAGLLLFFFAPNVIIDNLVIISGIIGLFVFAVVVGWLRGKLSLPHLLSAKIAAIFMYLFVLHTLFYGYYPPLFYVTAAIGAWAVVEQFVVLCFKSPSLTRRWAWE